MNRNFEVVVVDSRSSDGSVEILKKYEAEKKITLIEQKCSRGKGRQIAFQASTGEFVISNIDLDEVYPPEMISSVLELEPYARENLVMVNTSWQRLGAHGFTLAGRKILENLGGWRDLNYCEDIELWRRAARAGRYVWTARPMSVTKDAHGERFTVLGKARMRYTVYLSRLMVGTPSFGESERITTGQLIIYYIARFVALFKTSFKEKDFPDFDRFDRKYQIVEGELQKQQSS